MPLLSCDVNLPAAKHVPENVTLASIIRTKNRVRKWKLRIHRIIESIVDANLSDRDHNFHNGDLAEPKTMREPYFVNFSFSSEAHLSMWCDYLTTKEEKGSCHNNRSLAKTDDTCMINRISYSPSRALSNRTAHPSITGKILAVFQFPCPIIPPIDQPNTPQIGERDLTFDFKPSLQPWASRNSRNTRKFSQTCTNWKGNVQRSHLHKGDWLLDRRSH